MPELEEPRAPDRHCLLIDQGSSRIKWIGAVWQAMSGNWDLDVTTFGEGALEDLEAALDSGDMLPPEEILLTSVASAERLTEVEDALVKRSSADLVRLGSQAETCGIRNAYRKPEQLGSDRWMAVVGAARHHGLPVVVMDMGTASTFDAVDVEGRHLGGLIFPGPATMLGALGACTDLDTGELESEVTPRRVAGEAQRDTLRAIEGGIVTAQMGALRQFLHWLQGQWGHEAVADLKIVATGGGVGAILSQSDYQLTHDPLLVFKGMLISRYGSGDHRVYQTTDQ